MSIISEDKQHEILELLESIERERNISILHAVESGSRAWGFPSKDSDYDVRIIYCHERDWYISPFNKKDSIDVPITDELDVAGWDIGKALGLLYKGNATVHEWINSPVVYKSYGKKFTPLKQFSTTEFDPAPAFYHYVSLAKKKLLDEATRLNAKSFLYAFRSLLCAKWISDYQSAPAVWFPDLTKHYLSENLTDVLDDMLENKFHLDEKDHYEIPSALWLYAQTTYDKMSDRLDETKKTKDQASYESLLRSIFE